MTLLTIIIFLLVLGVIVFVHELGHFATAKFFGVKVEEFGLGFPPKILGKKKGETEYTLNWIPLGGFVKITGEDGENAEDPRSFGAKPAWQRIVILAAGVTMNFLLAIVLFSLVFMSGRPMDVSGLNPSELPAGTVAHVQITGVNAGSPAEKAGLAPMDNILRIDGTTVTELTDLQDYTKANADKAATVTVERQGAVSEKQVVIGKEPNGQGAIGVSLAKTAIIRYAPLDAVREGIVYTWDLTAYIFQYLVSTVQQLLSTGGTTAQVSGPVGMVSMTGQVVQLGLAMLLNFIGLISVNLAIINILPLPALDGGRILFVLAEKLKGSPVSREFEAKVHNTGFMLLMLLMLVVTFQDIARLGVWSKLSGMF
jgi:regulator of sigma E protease